MLTFEEMLIARHELRKLGYHFAYYFGTPREGYTLRCSKYPPLSDPWWGEPYIEIRTLEDVRRYLGGVSA